MSTLTSNLRMPRWTMEQKNVAIELIDEQFASKEKKTKGKVYEEVAKLIDKSTGAVTQMYLAHKAKLKKTNGKPKKSIEKKVNDKYHIKTYSQVSKFVIEKDGHSWEIDIANDGISDIEDIRYNGPNPLMAEFSNIVLRSLHQDLDKKAACEFWNKIIQLRNDVIKGNAHQVVEF